MNASKNCNGANGTDNCLKGGIGGENPRNALKEAVAKIALARPPELKLPPQNRPDMSALDLLDLQEEEANQRDREIAPRIGEWMENDSLPNLDKIEAKVERLGSKVLKLVAGKNEVGENITFGQQRDEYIRLNAEYLAAAFSLGETENGEPFLLVALDTRRAAHMAVMKYRLRAEMDREQLINVINSFVDEGYFLERQEGFIRAWQKRFMLSEDERFGELGEDEERLLAEMIGHHVCRINGGYRDDVREQAEKLQKEHEGFQLHQLFSGEAGKCFIHVPSEMRGNFKVSEVYLLVEGDGKNRAFVVEAIGPDRNNALAIKERKLFLWLPTLGSPRPPRVDTLIDKGLTEEDAKLLQRFWGYLDRARKAKEANDLRELKKELAAKTAEKENAFWKKALEEALSLRKEYASEATIGLDRVILETGPMEGIFFVEFQGDWYNPNGSIIPNGLLYFQGEQRVVDGKPQIRILKAPAHLLDRFFVESHTKFAEYGQFFKGLEQPLQGLMKALRTKAKPKKV